MFTSSSHLLLFSSSHLQSSSHLLIFTSLHLHIFTSAHLLIFSSSHLRIFASSLSLCLLPSVTVSLLLFLFSLKAAGSADEAPRSGHPFARNEVRVSKTEVKLRSCGVGRFECRSRCARKGLCAKVLVR